MKAYLAMWRETPHLAALLTLLGVGWISAGVLLVVMIYEALAGNAVAI